jgi:hypothetical protein
MSGAARRQMTSNTFLDIAFDVRDCLVKQDRIAVPRDQKSHKYAGVQEEILPGRCVVFWLTE